jgi:hypothetical protein
MSKHNNIVINCRLKSKNRNEEPCSTPTSFLEQLSSIDQNNLILTLCITRTEITPTSLLFKLLQSRAGIKTIISQ